MKINALGMRMEKLPDFIRERDIKFFGDCDSHGVIMCESDKQKIREIKKQRCKSTLTKGKA